MKQDRVTAISLPTPFHVGAVNVYLVRDDALTLVDAGAKTGDAWDRLARGLADCGVAPSDIERILLTHGHVDHMGLLGRLLEESEAEAFAHPLVAEQSLDPDETEELALDHKRALMAELGVPHDLAEACLEAMGGFRAFREEAVVGQAVEDGHHAGPYTVYHVPGHSATDTLFVDGAERIAFTGDHLLKDVQPVPLLRRPNRPGEDRPRSLVQFHASLRRTHALDLRVCYPGHGAPIEDHRALIERQLERHERKLEQVRGYIAGGPATPFEIARRMFPRLDAARLYFGLSVAAGMLEMLEERGQAQRERNGAVQFSIAKEGPDFS